MADASLGDSKVENESLRHFGIVTELRIKFNGNYDKEEDDFIGNTYFCNPLYASGEQPRFGKSDKRICGLLYLRTLRFYTVVVFHLPLENNHKVNKPTDVSEINTPQKTPECCQPR